MRTVCYNRGNHRLACPLHIKQAQLVPLLCRTRETMAHVLVGIDIGGTNVKVGITNFHGQVLARSQAPVDRQASVENVVDNARTQLLALLQELKIETEEIHAVGTACPGVMLEPGVIRAAHNFPTWSNAPLGALMEKAMGKPVHVINDADAAILAEQWVGSAKDGIHDLIMLTLGTGVGCGIIVNNELVRGGTDTIEGGHVIVERNGRLCGCSQRGCLETYSSATALVTEAQEHLSAGADTLLAKYPSDKIDAELIFQVAAEGDAMCNRLIEEAADYLGFACVNFCRSLDPQLIVLAGGMAEAGETFVELVRKSYAKYAWTQYPNPVKIEKATAGYDAGVIGAAAAVRPH